MARIVIVEDEIQVPMLAESVLQRAGHDTVSACTVNSKDEKFELVFADIELGNHKEGGLTTGKLVGGGAIGRAGSYTCGRLATDGMKSLFVECSAFLSKPYTAQQLTEAVADLFRK